MTPSPREVEIVYRVLARTYPRAAPLWIVAKAAHPLPGRTTHAALRVLLKEGLACSPRRGQYAARAPATARAPGLQRVRSRAF